MEALKFACITVLIFFNFFKKIKTEDETVTWDCSASDQTCNIQKNITDGIGCGIFKKYNPKTTRTLPELYGFAGGVTFDNKTQYIGFGRNFCGYPAQIPCPAYIQTEKPAGAYTFCANTTNFDDNQAFFLLNHTDLRWVETDSTQVKSIPTILKVTGLFYSFAIGRIKLKGGYKVGKIHLDRQAIGLRLKNADGRGSIATVKFQVLTCMRCKNNGTGQYCCRNGADNPDCCLNGGYGKNCVIPCGHQLLLKNNDPDDPKTRGFDSGKFVDNSTVYPGTGFFKAWDSTDVARIQTVKRLKGPGAYIGWGNKYFFDNERARYFVPHEKLKWIETNISTAKTVNGALQNHLRRQYGDASEGVDYFVRVTITSRNGTYQQIGFMTDNEVCYWNGTNTRCDTSASRKYDILACVP